MGKIFRSEALELHAPVADGILVRRPRISLIISSSCIISDFRQPATRFPADIIDSSSMIDLCTQSVRSLIRSWSTTDPITSIVEDTYKESRSNERNDSEGCEFIFQFHTYINLTEEALRLQAFQDNDDLLGRFDTHLDDTVETRLRRVIEVC